MRYNPAVISTVWYKLILN